jgi:DNA-binding NtrC family response regulator
VLYSPANHDGPAAIVLVVDPDTHASDRLQLELQNWGYHVEVELARTADQLHHRLQSGTDPDLIISELKLGADSVLNVFSELRRIPVLFWTSAANIESVVAAMKMGALDVLEKSADHSKLRAAIDQVLRNNVGADQAKQMDDPMLGRSYTARLDGATPIEKAQILAILSALQKTDGNVCRAARELGIGQATVYRKMKKYAIHRTARTVRELSRSAARDVS